MHHKSELVMLTWTNIKAFVQSYLNPNRTHSYISHKCKSHKILQHCIDMKQNGQSDIIIICTMTTLLEIKCNFSRTFTYVLQRYDAM